MKYIIINILSLALVYSMYSILNAETYLVGSERTYATIQDVENLLEPGDVVQVDGNATYPSGAYISRNGTADNWITISGIHPTGGARPVITGSSTYGIDISADYIILEGFEVIGCPKGIGVFGDNIKVRACIINGCNHGLIGYGTGTGNVTVEYCEFYGNGVPTGGATQHQIYMATDEYNHPGSVFRLQYCYLHDCVEGDNVKSRSERNEIYYNWIEYAGTSGHGLGLFAPDPEDNENVLTETAREDADVVGNVIIQNHNACARIGGDTPGYPTKGRYRFVNNTFIITGSRGDAIRTFNTIETLEMYNNVIYSKTSGSDIRVINDADGEWVHLPRSIIGSNNWVITWASMVPAKSEWSNTITSSTSPFADADAQDYYPGQDSTLINAGVSETPTITLYPFPTPLFPPEFHPPQAALIDTGTAQTWPNDGTIDIGAFEASFQAKINYQPGNKRSPALDICNTSSKNLSVVNVYGVNGRSVGTMSRVGSGLLIIQLKDGNKILNKRTLLKIKY